MAQLLALSPGYMYQMLCTALTLTSFCMTAGSRQLDRHEAAIIAREAAIVDVEVNNFTVSLYA